MRRSNRECINIISIDIITIQYNTFVAVILLCLSFVGHFSSSAGRFALTRHIVTVGTHTILYNNIILYIIIYYGKTLVPFRIDGLNIIILISVIWVSINNRFLRNVIRPSNNTVHTYCAVYIIITLLLPVVLMHVYKLRSHWRNKGRGQKLEAPKRKYISSLNKRI